MSHVHVVLPGGRQVLAGELRFDRTPAGTVAAVHFTYATSYLADPGAYPLSPELPLAGGRYLAPRLFGCFADAQPDAWGRHLLALATRRRGERVTDLTEEDFLLQVADETRLGALRFHDQGQFQAPPGEGAATVVDIASLARAATAVLDNRDLDNRDDDERDNDERDDDAAIGLLLRAGSSLGGARPKATVVAADGTLWLAKFASPDDRWDVQLWEVATLRLAREAGIQTPAFEYLPSTLGHGVLLARRFDRAGDGERIGYASAATLLEHEFGSGRKPDYVALSETLQAESANPGADARELFRRVAFSVLVRNTDDHMRNHGVLRGPSGWRLSPVFDVNPQPLRIATLAPTPIAPDDAGDVDRDIRLLVDHADAFRLTRAAAIEMVREVDRAVSRWVEVALAAGVAHDETGFMARAFENPNRERAQNLRAGG